MGGLMEGDGGTDEGIDACKAEQVDGFDVWTDRQTDRWMNK